MPYQCIVFCTYLSLNCLISSHYQWIHLTKGRWCPWAFKITQGTAMTTYYLMGYLPTYPNNDDIACGEFIVTNQLHWTTKRKMFIITYTPSNVSVTKKDVIHKILKVGSVSGSGAAPRLLVFFILYITMFYTKLVRMTCYLPQYTLQQHPTWTSEWNHLPTWDVQRATFLKSKLLELMDKIHLQAHGASFTRSTKSALCLGHGSITQYKIIFHVLTSAVV